MNNNISVSTVPKAIGPYSLATKAGNFIFCSGQIGISAETGALIGNTIQEQTVQVLQNIDSILSQYDYTKENVVKTTVYLKHIQDFDVFNTVYAEYFDNHKPARSTIEVSNLPKNALVEIEVVAHS